jgi:hypothetical protein
MCKLAINDLPETTELDRVVMAEIQGGFLGGYAYSGGYLRTATPQDPCTPNDPCLIASQPIYG